MATFSGETQKSAAAIQFPHFDTVSDHSDHYYIKSHQSNKAKNAFKDITTKTCKSIMKEWKILEKNLPESIYVRVYETRMDLLRAVIVGPPGTPYHDGLFFFDIVFPSDYPAQPPKVYYLSRGYRLNPNLYANGTVCLSLINTWNGTKLERWTPKNSTILQLLVSIQGLVLNDKPYFNEPGYERHKMSARWVNTSLAYNAEVFILSCKTMLHHIRTPPRHFEDFVSEHFRDRGQFILAAIKAYRDLKVIVGQYSGDGQSSSSGVVVSAGFQKNAKKMIADLQIAFKKLSASSPNQVVEEAKEPAAEAKKEKRKHKENSSSLKPKVKAIKEKPKGGFVQMIKGFVKKIFD